MKLHHIGKVVGDLDEAVKYHRETFGFKPLGDAVIDPIQKVEVILMEMGCGDEITLELIKPVSDDSPVAKFLKKGGGLHHLSFAVENIAEAIEDLKKKGALILGETVPSKAHDENPSTWLYTRSRELIELIEKEQEK